MTLCSEITHRKQAAEAKDRDAGEGKRWASIPAYLNAKNKSGLCSIIETKQPDFFTF